MRPATLFFFLFVVFLVVSLQEGPVIGVVVVESEVLEEIFEKRPHVGVVWLLIELQSSRVVAVLVELVREASAEVLDFGQDFLFFDFFVLVLDVSGSQILPGQGASEEVQEDVAQRFDVVSSGLLDAWG